MLCGLPIETLFFVYVPKDPYKTLLFVKSSHVCKVMVVSLGSFGGDDMTVIYLIDYIHRSLCSCAEVKKHFCLTYF